MPVFKSGDKFDTNNYRPISLLPVFSKILEKLLFDRIIKLILKHNLTHPNQHGFFKERSTDQAMCDIADKIIDAIENKKLCIGVFIDLSKAFDTISHEILLNKLLKYGIRGNFHHPLNHDSASNLQEKTCCVL